MVLTVVAALLSAAPQSIALPGGPPVGMDYLAFDASTGRLWIPAGNTGRIDVLDTKSGKLESIEGVATAKRGERVAGPTAASAGPGVVFVGNRADSSICAWDAKTLKKGACAQLASTPDGVQFVRATQEVWVTTPDAKSISVLKWKDGALTAGGAIQFEGEPEGYWVDEEKGVFWTNLEDKDRTLSLDVRTRRILSDWPAACGEKGPRGLVSVPAQHAVVVACTDRLKVHSVPTGEVTSELETGQGVDNIDWLPSHRWIFAGSGKAAKLTVAELTRDGKLVAVREEKTAEGCRTVILDGAGRAYLPDSRGGRLVVVPALAAKGAADEPRGKDAESKAH